MNLDYAELSRMQWLAKMGNKFNDSKIDRINKESSQELMREGSEAKMKLSESLIIGGAIMVISITTAILIKIKK